MKQLLSVSWLLALYFLFAIGLTGGFDHGFNLHGCLIGVASAIIAPLIIFLTWLALKNL